MERYENSLQNSWRKAIYVLQNPSTPHPSFFIDKKDGKLRPVQDYRCINDYTLCNQYPLPLITDLITDLRGPIFTQNWIFDEDTT